VNLEGATHEQRAERRDDKMQWIVALAVLFGSALFAQDIAAHNVQFVTVEKDV
jgi:hypothetical protein